jgi:hypothetical protein
MPRRTISFFSAAQSVPINPNVLYEVGVLDSLGRLCIPVKLKPDGPKKKGKNAKDPLPFDRAAYRCFFVDLKEPVRARKQVGEVIRKSRYPPV